MQPQFHYSLTPPVEFESWISVYTSRLGEPNRLNVAQEINIDLDELEEHNPLLIQWLASIDCEIYTTRLFRSWPHYQYRLHIDVDPSIHPANEHFVYDHVIKLNFPFYSVDSRMSWYALKPGSAADHIVNPSGYGSFNFKEEQCDLLESHAANGPCLIHAGRIHTLTNARNRLRPRLCYSLMITNRSRTWSWSDAVAAFSPWITRVDTAPQN